MQLLKVRDILLQLKDLRRDYQALSQKHDQEWTRFEAERKKGIDPAGKKEASPRVKVKIGTRSAEKNKYPSFQRAKAKSNPSNLRKSK